MPFAELGTLEDQLARNISWPERVYLLYQAAEGVAFAHSCNAVHRDLKAANILVFDGMIAVIADFGLAKFKTSARDTMTVATKGVIGTEIYASPEIIEEEEKINYFKSDAWSFAMVIVQCITGRPPYSEETKSRVINNKIANAEWPKIDETALDRSPPVIRELLHRCLQKNPRNRPTFKEIAHSLATSMVQPAAPPKPDLSIFCTQAAIRLETIQNFFINCKREGEEAILSKQVFDLSVNGKMS
jgi:serine/threonine protein kinase